MESARGAAGWALLLLHCRTASWCCDERLVIVLECSVQAKSMLKSGRKARKELGSNFIIAGICRMACPPRCEQR